MWVKRQDNKATGLNSIAMSNLCLVTQQYDGTSLFSDFF